MRLGRNLLVGLLNSALAAVVGLAATAGYLHYLGVERYGVIGVFVTIQALLSLLDMGLSPTLNREVARATATGDWIPARGLLASLSRLYWALALSVLLLLLAVAPWLAGRWLQRDALGVAEVADALAWMGLAVACRAPAGLYASAINGAQRLALSSSLASAYALFSAAGALVLLACLEASLGVFFAWQGFAALLYTMGLRAAAWRVLGGSGARPDWVAFRRVWRFSAGMGLIALTSVVFTQLDKVLLSRLLSLEAFGRYALATLLVGGLYVVVVPIFNAIYPRFSALVAAGEEQQLWDLYRLGTRMVVTLIFPLALVLVVLAEPIVAIWTQDGAIAVAVAPVLSLLGAGTALHAVMYMPYALQLANGLPRLAVGINLTMILILVPLTVSLTLAHAEVGAATAWLALHVLYVLLGTSVTHRYLFPGRGGRWLARDVGLPLLLSLGVGAAARASGLPSVEGLAVSLGAALAIWLAATVACLAVSPALRIALRPHLGAWGRWVKGD